MEEHFVNYNQALALKELGFNEKCFAAYRDSEWIGHDGPNSRYFHAQLFSNSMFDDDQQEYCSAPLKSQVFKWMTDNYGLINDITLDINQNNELEGFYIIMHKLNGLIMNEDDDIELSVKTNKKEEAESACIDKLIEIIKEKKS